ncbi:MAG: BON domain-containing protein [Bdellovibrionales bacterium]|nr:BON domain-containing protein [Bdellovibrionales bacterium]
MKIHEKKVSDQNFRRISEDSKVENSGSYSIMLGDTELNQEISNELESHGLYSWSAKNMKELYKKTSRPPRALIFSVPFSKGNPNRWLRSLRKRKIFRGSPAILVIPEWRNSDLLSEYYKSGFSVIILWPKEKQKLSSLFIEKIDFNLIDTASDNTSTALEKAIVNRIKIEFGKLSPKLKIVVDESIASVSGTVKSVWKKKATKSAVLSTPGISAFHEDSITIVPFEHSDEEILRVANELLAENHPNLELTILLQVKNSNVTISGTSSSYAAIENLKDNVEKIEGVQKVIKECIISPSQQSIDHALATSINEKLRKINPSRAQIVTVKVINGIAKIEGTIKSVTESYIMQKEVQTTKGIKWVDNHLKVTNF